MSKLSEVRLEHQIDIEIEAVRLRALEFTKERIRVYCRRYHLRFSVGFYYEVGSLTRESNDLYSMKAHAPLREIVSWYVDRFKDMNFHNEPDWFFDGVTGAEEGKSDAT